MTSMVERYDQFSPEVMADPLPFCAPAQWFLRTVREPTRVAGTPISPGQRVMCLVASAARDEREYANPEEFHWDRRIERSVSFGRGQHFCIGFHLARLELAILAEEFLREEVAEANAEQVESAVRGCPKQALSTGE
jgi:cytochrome P450